LARITVGVDEEPEVFIPCSAFGKVPGMKLSAAEVLDDKTYRRVLKTVRTMSMKKLRA
jgi:hypothetical protein